MNQATLEASKKDPLNAAEALEASHCGWCWSVLGFCIKLVKSTYE